MSDTNDIRIITEPSVYIVGKQVIGDAELDRFLADHGVSWESDSSVAAEVLTETAGAPATCPSPSRGRAETRPT